MSFLEALKAARAAGVEVRVDGKDLVLAAASEPPADVLDMLSRHKPDLVEHLRAQASPTPSAPAPSPRVARPRGWSAADWRLFHNDRQLVAELAFGKTWQQARTYAYACCIRGWCRVRPGSTGAQAIAALAEMGITDPSAPPPAPAPGALWSAAAAGAETAAASVLITGTEVAGSASGAGPAHVAILRQTQGDKRSTDDWQAFVDQQVRIAEGDGLARPAADARAFDAAVAEWMLRNPVNSAPGACPLCGVADRPGDLLQFIGIIGARTWLHIGCSTIWVRDRKAEAVAALAAMGIKSPGSSS